MDYIQPFQAILPSLWLPSPFFWFLKKYLSKLRFKDLAYFVTCSTFLNKKRKEKRIALHLIKIQDHSIASTLPTMVKQQLMDPQQISLGWPLDNKRWNLQVTTIHPALMCPCVWGPYPSLFCSPPKYIVVEENVSTHLREVIPYKHIPMCFPRRCGIPLIANPFWVYNNPPPTV